MEKNKSYSNSKIYALSYVFKVENREITGAVKATEACWEMGAAA